MAKKSFFSADFLPVIQKYVEQLRAIDSTQVFKTIDVIRKYIGHYVVDNVDVGDSINGNIGTFLSENEEALRIKKKDENISVKDDNGKPSHTSTWEFI